MPSGCYTFTKRTPLDFYLNYLNIESLSFILKLYFIKLGGFMNTNNVYIASICVVTNIKTKGTKIIDMSIIREYGFLRNTLVYHTKNNRFYDLVARRFISADFHYAEVGSEVLNTETLTPFNYMVDNNKDRLSKRKIKKIYMNYTNNSDYNQ